MKKIRLLFLTLVALIGMALPSHAADVTVYIDPVGDGTWTSDDAKISLNVFTDGQTNNTWIALSAVEGNVLKATFDDSYNRMIIVRGANQDAWGWNQTENITPVKNKLYKANGYTGSNLAYTVSDYVGYMVDFNTTITTSNYDFSVGSNWGHVVDYLEYDDYGTEYAYVNYTFSSNGGVDGTGALGAYSQNLSGGGDSKTAYDLLITPLIQGTVTIDVKAMNYSDASLEVYALESDGKTKSTLIKSVSYSDLSTTDYTTISFELATEQRVGLRLNRVYIDNFAASSATILAEPKLSITSVKKATDASNVYFEQQADGSLLVQLYVTLKNDGEVDFEAGVTENYTLSVLQDYYGTKAGPFGAFAIPVNLAKGATSEPILLEIYIPAGSVSSLKEWGNWYVIENVTSSQSTEYVWASWTAYEPKFVFRESGSTSTSSISAAEAWGTITESKTKSFEIANTGTAPLTINSIEIPEGFKSSSPSSVVLERAGEYDGADAIWAAWTWDTDRNAGEWVVEDEGKFTGQIKKYVTFVRMNPEADDIPGWGAAWNQTEDLVINPGMTTYVIDSWNGGTDDKLGGHWKAITLAKGETKAISITNDASVTGTYAGNLVIKYLDKEAVEQTYELAFSTTVIGANTWTADFNNSTSTVVYPEGSVAEGGIYRDYQYISSGNYNNWLIGRTGSDYNTENNKFITPKLHANAGDQLAFDVKAGYSGTNDYFVKVYVSTDRKTWGEPVAYYTYTTDATKGSEGIGSAFTTKTVTFDTAGDYYVAFALYGSSGIDNLVGLEKVDVAHDLYIKSVSWPDASVKSGSSLSKPSVTFIPLTAETAENYTVKYLCGTTVLGEGTSEALTASATSSTDIAVNWTPNVTETTVYPETKVVIEFTDGTKFETETFDLTVTNEPIFHFVKTLPSSKWNEPSDYTTPITFGKTNSADVQSFYVYNWGSAPLTVNSISLPEGFTTTTEFPITVAAMDESDLSVSAKTLDITFSATESGTYSGDMVITYSGDQTFTLAVTGTKLDPTKFYATFGSSSDASNFPAGSLAQANISITTPTTDNGAIVSSSSTKNLFITPLLASEGETLQFDAKKRSSYYDGSVKVYALSDHIAAANTTTDAEFEALSPTLLGEYTVDVSDFTTYSVEIPTGSSYIALKVADAYVDEIYGLKVANVAHDWQIASSNIYAEAMQNVASTATVNVLNLGIADEAADSYTVTAYVNGVAAGTGEAVAIPMNHKLSDAGTQLSVTYMSNVAGTFPVYLEVKAGDYSIATDPVDVTFAAEEAKTKADMATNGTAGDSPLNLNYHNSESVTMYNAEALAAVGISGGTKIKKITYKGYKDTDEQTTSFQVYYKWTDDQTLAQPETTYPYAAEDNGMTKLIDEDHTWAKVGSSSELGEMIVLDFSSDPLTYEEGKSLVIYMHSYVNSYKAAYFEKSTLSTDYCYERQQDYTNITNKWNKKNPAALHFTLDASVATLDGKVQTSAGAGIEGATVTLKAENGVQYTGTSAADGSYSMNVIQAGLDFTATIEADGFLKREFALNMGGESKTNDVTMYKQFGIVGSLPGLDWNNDLVMTQSAEDPNIFTAELTGANVTEAGTFKYKLRADGAWATDLTDGYELPASGDEEWEIKTAGTYNYKFTFDWTNHTLTFERPYTLSDGVQELNWVDITIDREFKAGWNAIVLPFDMSAEEVKASFGESAEVAYFAGDENNGGDITVRFNKRPEGSIEAGVPYLVWSEAAVSGLKFTKDVTATQHNTTGTNFDFVGVYTTTTTSEGDYFMQGGEFKKTGNDNTVLPFRAYLKLKAPAASVRSVNVVFGEEGMPTSIDALQIDGLNGAEGAYNLSGQKVHNLQKGRLYIVNGKKVIKK